MNNSNQNKQSSVLRQWMTDNQISSYREWSLLAQVSELQFHRLENGLLESIPLGVLNKIARSLNIPVVSFIDSFSERENPAEKLAPEIESQQEAISILESLIIQLPTFIHAVNQNPQLPAQKLLPLLKPLDDLLSAWDISKIGSVGDIVTYNPQEHELMENNLEEINDIKQVKIRYVGYRHQDKLLYRAKVSSIVD